MPLTQYSANDSNQTPNYHNNRSSPSFTIALFNLTERLIALSLSKTITSLQPQQQQRKQTQQATKRLTLLTDTMAGTKLQDSKSP